MKRAFNLFPGIIFAFIALNMCIVGLTVYLAASDRSAAIEPDYYRKAVAWDTIARQRQRNAALAWSVRIVTSTDADGTAALSLTLVDAASTPITDAAIRLTAFPSARAADRMDLTLTESAPGVYTAPWHARRAGLWEFEVLAHARDETFTSHVSTNLDPVARP